MQSCFCKRYVPNGCVRYGLVGYVCREQLNYMVVLIDVLIVDPSLDKDAPPERYHLFAELLEFVVGRLKPLERQINEEESREEIGNPCCTIIHIKDEFKITMHGYSSALLSKMRECITPSDLSYIADKVNGDISGYLN